MNDKSFAAFISRERERLHAARNEIASQQQQLRGKLNEINREFSAIDAYQAAKTGKTVTQPTARQRQRARRGSKRQMLLQLINRHPNGLVRRDILEQLGLKGDKAGEMSVSNALTSLTKANQVRRQDGRYMPA